MTWARDAIEVSAAVLCYSCRRGFYVSLGSVTIFVSFVFGIVLDVVTLISARLCVHDALIMGSWTGYITGISDG